MDVYSSFERMEVNKDNVGSLKSQRDFTKPEIQLLTSLGVEFRIW